MLASNCGFDKVEIFPGNIGYVKFDAFMDADICGATVAAAMDFAAHTDALIFDLRDNGGGQPATVSLIASYLFDKPTHLNDLYDRHENSTTKRATGRSPGFRASGCRRNPFSCSPRIVRSPVARSSPTT